MNIEIDKLTPCLEKISTGKIVNTIYSKALPEELKKLKGWRFKWSAVSQSDFEIFKLNVEDDSRIQGLVAIANVVSDKAVYEKLPRALHITLVKSRNIWELAVICLQ